jgi:DNA-binding CsgD family transcriptional regulator
MDNIEEILNCADVYVLAKNKHAKYTYCNEKYAELLHLDSPKQIIGKTDFDFFPKNIAAICFEGDKYVLNGFTLWNYFETIQLKSNIHILINKSPLVKKSGANGVVASFIEKTDSTPSKIKELMSYEEKQKRYYFMINQTKEYFTELEYAIFKKLFLGISSKKIASYLSLSSRTVEAYVAEIKRKLQCAHKSDIIETAIRYGITHPSNSKS